jgi:hypothetical protein
VKEGGKGRERRKKGREEERKRKRNTYSILRLKVTSLKMLFAHKIYSPIT